VHVALTEEQELLRLTATALAAKIGPSSPADLGADRPPDGAAWRLLADAGLLGLRVPEVAGGAGASGVEVMIVAEAIGYAAATAPFVGSAVLATELLVACGAPGLVLERLASGEQRAAVALTPSLEAPGDAVAFDAAGASTALVLDGNRVLSVPCDGDDLRGADLTRALVRLAGTDGEAVGSVDPSAMARWLALALTALSADSVGLMSSALDGAVAYVKDRVQFGVPVGTFQAVQHLLADQRVTVEAARSAVAYAAWAVDALDPGDALLAARTAKAYCAEAGRDVVEAAIQAHGGIGMTWECMAHVHLRRALLDRQVLGDEHHQLAAIAEARLAG
jgi:alkylation response protein AidB-like acyl-CoA dehydrogenase